MRLSWCLGELRADLGVAELPSTTVPSPEDGAIEGAKSSLQTLVVLFVTSPQLRSLVHDAVYLARDIFDAVAEDTGGIGEVATAVVDRVAETIAPEVPENLDKAARKEETPAETPAADNKPADPKSAEDLRDEFLDRFKEVRTLGTGTRNETLTLERPTRSCCSSRRTRRTSRQSGRCSRSSRRTCARLSPPCPSPPP